MQPPCVLVVDDSDLVRAMTADVAAHAGFRVQLAKNGAEALKMLADEPPDLVLTDVYMPAMDGSELILRMRQIPACYDVAAVVITADDSRETRIELLRAGADDVLVKPVSDEELVVRLRSIIRRRRPQAPPARGSDPGGRALEARVAELERVVEALAGAAEGADVGSETIGNHARRVAGGAALLARRLGCEADYVEQIRRYAGLYDVGKGLVARALLEKPGLLAGGEVDAVRAHARLGATLLRNAGLPVIARNIAAHHHERWDGRGYPDGLAREGIPLEARIVAVVEVFDALISPRSHRPAWSLDRARAYVEDAAGTQFDPAIVRAFQEQQSAILRIAQVHADEPPGHEVVLGR
jgi:response regulator RpfG family c-di-GMP phosphodiesterase